MLGKNLSSAKFTGSGIILAFCEGVLVIAIMAARQLGPGSFLGQIVSSTQGLILALIAAWLLFVIAAKILALLGHPIVVLPSK